MEIVLYYAPNACSLVPYITLSEASASFEVRPLDIAQGSAKSSRLSQTQSQAQSTAAWWWMGVRSARTSPFRYGSRAIFRRPNCCPLIPGRNCRPFRCWPGVRPAYTLISPASIRRLGSATCLMPTTAFEDWPMGPLFENYKIADDMLAGREHFFDHFTAADAHFFWCFRRGSQFDLDLSEFPNCR